VHVSITVYPFTSRQHPDIGSVFRIPHIECVYIIKLTKAEIINIFIEYAHSLITIFILYNFRRPTTNPIQPDNTS